MEILLKQKTMSLIHIASISKTTKARKSPLSCVKLCICKQKSQATLSNTYLCLPPCSSGPFAVAAFSVSLWSYFSRWHSAEPSLSHTQTLAWCGGMCEASLVSGAHESPPHCQSIWATVRALGLRWPTSARMQTSSRCSHRENLKWLGIGRAPLTSKLSPFTTKRGPVCTRRD